ncbi:N-acetylmuramoyl-L-alanine amidase [Arcobacteraceae bacterium]|nr:N-acetylmuramoyl-L-alanine amidase [Arcobacteraceae bacterium]
MKIVVKTFIIICILFQSVFAVDSKYYKDKFTTTKKLYLGSIMASDKEKEILYLKKLVIYGDKLNISTLKYKRELNRLDNKSVIKNTTKSVLPKKYTIKSVYQSKNSIIINFNKKINNSFIDFKELKEKNKYHDEFYIKGNFKDASPTKLTISGVDKISIFQKNSNVLGLVFKHRTNLKTIYIVNRKQIIIKVLNLKKSKKNEIIKKVQKTKSKAKTKVIKKKVKVINTNVLYPSKKTVVIDAGHGGRDGGASFGKKRLEKNISLKISKYVKEELQRKGFKVFLTRTSDKYVKLSSRTKYANSKHADMFISIHANAAPKKSAKKAHGIESYFLSPARSARAKRVAALENKGDMTGMGWSSKDSLLTILNRAKITAANKMAIDIQRNMLYNLRNQYGKSNIRDGGVREGPFWVLVGAQMPSVLVEVGYITHPTEGYRISTTRYQKLIANGIANGVESYFRKN